MDIDKILSDLRQQRTEIDGAINSLERLTIGRSYGTSSTTATMPRKRGRPPGSKNKKAPATSKTDAAAT